MKKTTRQSKARKLVLVVARTVYSYQAEDGSDLEEARAIDNSDEIAKYPKGSKYVVDYGAPGRGRCTYEIVAINEQGAFGCVVSDTLRILAVGDVK